MNVSHDSIVLHNKQLHVLYLTSLEKEVAMAAKASDYITTFCVKIHLHKETHFGNNIQGGYAHF